MTYDKKEIEKKLQERLKRIPKEDEITNSDKDPNIICEILFDRVIALEKRVTKLGG